MDEFIKTVHRELSGASSDISLLIQVASHLAFDDRGQQIHADIEFPLVIKQWLDVFLQDYAI